MPLIDSLLDLVNPTLPNKLA